MKYRKSLIGLSIALALSGVAMTTMAADGRSIGEPGRTDKPSKAPNPLKNVYFGEQHLHTSNSPDAFMIGVRGTWEDAYNWALGKEIKLSTTGEKIRKSTPYDFVGITDHAEYFGVMPAMLDPNDPISKTDLAKLMTKDPNAAAVSYTHLRAHET